MSTRGWLTRPAAHRENLENSKGNRIMAKPKDATQPKTDDEELPLWDGSTQPETFCSKCQGMVNHNGCELDGCPTFAK